MTTRIQAIEAGTTTYTPDRPCKRGHTERYTSNGMCVKCLKRHAEAVQAKKIERRNLNDDGFDTITITARSHLFHIIEKFKELMLNGTPEQIKSVENFLTTMAPRPPLGKILHREALADLLVTKPFDQYVQCYDNKFVQFGGDWYDIDEVQRLNNSTVNFIFAADPSTIDY